MRSSRVSNDDDDDVSMSESFDAFELRAYEFHGLRFSVGLSALRTWQAASPRTCVAGFRGLFDIGFDAIVCAICQSDCQK